MFIANFKNIIENWITFLNQTDIDGIFPYVWYRSDGTINATIYFWLLSFGIVGPNV